MKRRAPSAILIFVALALILIAGIESAKPAQGSEETVLYHPLFPNSPSSELATLYVQNPSDAPAGVSLLFNGNARSILYEESIAPKAIWAVPATEVPGLREGSYSLEVRADKPVETVVEIASARAEGDRLAVYRGQSGQQSSTLVFGPVFDRSELYLLGPWGPSATVVVSLYDATGALEAQYSAFTNPNETLRLDAATLGIPSGFVGSAVVNSDQPLIGLLSPGSNPWAQETVAEYQGPLGAGSAAAFLPRVMKRLDEGDTPRTTLLFVMNLGGDESDVVLTYLAEDGSTRHSRTISLPAVGSQLVDLAEEGALPNGSIWAVSATADESVLLGEFTYYNSPPYSYMSARYSGGTELTEDPDYDLTLPWVQHNQEVSSIFSLQNTAHDDAHVVLTYYDISGTLELTQHVYPPAQGWVRINLIELLGREPDFEGSVMVSADQPIAALVDDYKRTAPPCYPVSTVEMSRSPEGPIERGAAVRFTAEVSGSAPFTTIWTIDGTPAGGNDLSLDHTFDTTGTFTVGVEVSNACGSAADTLTLEVQPGPTDRPDLSTSFKSASLGDVESGDVLTYTLVLRNSQAITASATLTDAIPANTRYRPNSARASDGGPVTLNGDVLAWSGEVISGTPVEIEFATEVLTMSIGTRIDNVAFLHDGVGNTFHLTATSVYNPGYRLTIDDGALYTNVPTVTLRFSWDADDGITAFKISNDGGFGRRGNTTGWIRLDPAEPTYANWMLATVGDLRLPRTVYLKFRDARGTQYGPIQDEIVYDPFAPQVLNAEIVPALTAGLEASQGADVIVRVTAQDDISGISAIQLSHDTDFAAFSAFIASGPSVDIPWRLRESRVVYVRVLDRAGNVSSVSSARETNPGPVYLPLLTRPAP